MNMTTFNWLCCTFILPLMIVGFPCLAQTNESSTTLYQWKGKKTTFDKGYVVMKTGQRLEGSISATENFAMIIYKDANGKESEFPARSLLAFGLSMPNAIGETPDEFYRWGALGSFLTKDEKGLQIWVDLSKAVPGYIKLRTGNILIGAIQLRKSNGLVDEIKIFGSSGKEKYGLYEVSAYGIDLTVDQITKGGKATYAEKERNFHPGYVVTLDGIKKEGKLAYMKVVEASAEYYGVFVAGQSGSVVLYPKSGLKEIVQNIPEEMEAFVPETADVLDVQAIKSISRNGFIMTLDGKKFEGRVTHKKAPALWFSKEVVFTDDKGAETIYNATNPLDFFFQTTDDGNTKYICYGGVFVEVIVDGPKYVYFRSPTPGKKNEFVKELSSTLSDKTVSVYKKEYILFNTETRKGVPVDIGNYRAEAYDLLMGCMSFYSLDKQVKDKLTKMDNVKEALAYLNDCK